MDAKGKVEARVQLPKQEWERARLTNGRLGTLRIVYDPFDDTNLVLPGTALDSGSAYVTGLVLAVCAGCSLIAMSCLMVIDGFHCGPHFWGFPDCCNDCTDWTDKQTEPSLVQVCWRGGCDGVGGKSHMYWCSSTGPEECYIGWSMVPLPAAFGGISIAVMTTLQKNIGICRVGSKYERSIKCLCGQGKFCCPDQPPRIYRVAPSASERRVLLDLANPSDHL